MAEKPNDIVWIWAQLALLLAVILCPNPSAHWLEAGMLRQVMLLVFGMGLLLLFSGIIQLGGNLTAFPRPVAKGKLRTHGIYHLVRHPMYGGIMLAHFAFAALSLNPLQGALNLALIVFFTLKARKEEAYLLQTYPPYADYKKRTRWFIPFMV